MEPIYNIDALNRMIDQEQGLLLYFSNDSCNVCKVLKPKVAELLKEKFPKIRFGYIDTDKSPVLAGQYRVFTIPTILLFFEGKEQARFSRNIALFQLEEAISKPYSIIFEE
ncbi:MAG: thioredoxin family protein [Bacteroidota bacterium]